MQVKIVSKQNYLELQYNFEQGGFVHVSGKLGSSVGSSWILVHQSDWLIC